MLSSRRTRQIAFLGETEPRAARPGRIPASDPITLSVGPTVNKAVTSHWACFQGRPANFRQNESMVFPESQRGILRASAGRFVGPAAWVTHVGHSAELLPLSPATSFTRSTIRRRTAGRRCINAFASRSPSSLATKSSI